DDLQFLQSELGSGEYVQIRAPAWAEGDGRLDGALPAAGPARRAALDLGDLELRALEDAPAGAQVEAEAQGVGEHAAQAPDLEPHDDDAPLGPAGLDGVDQGAHEGQLVHEAASTGTPGGSPGGSRAGGRAGRRYRS